MSDRLAREAECHPGAPGNMQEDSEGSFAAFKVTLILGAQL